MKCISYFAWTERNKAASMINIMIGFKILRPCFTHRRSSYFFFIHIGLRRALQFSTEVHVDLHIV